MEKGSNQGDRYSAKLLFQYRVLVNGKSNIMRTCEERMVVLRSRSARNALSAAKRRGKSAQFQQTNPAGNKVLFEFVGVLDLLRLGPECEKDEVWYDIKVIKQPKERIGKVIPPERMLNAIQWAGANKPLRKTRSKQRASER
jgi:hypothetical protein